MADEVQVLDYSNSPAGSQNSPAPGKIVASSIPATTAATSKAHVNNTAPATTSANGNVTAPQGATLESGLSSQSKYAALLTVIEELGRDVRPTYAGNKLAAERLKRGIAHARVLVRECMSESDRMNRSAN